MKGCERANTQISNEFLEVAANGAIAPNRQPDLWTLNTDAGDGAYEVVDSLLRAQVRQCSYRHGRRLAYWRTEASDVDAIRHDVDPPRCRPARSGQTLGDGRRVDENLVGQ